MSSENLEQLNMLQHNLQNISVQKQQIEAQLNELNSALEGIKNTEKSYKIVGRIMISSSKEDLEKDLETKKEVTQVRLKSLISQEESVKKKFEETQQSVMKNLQKEEKKN
jgi:prefoldin beta subunit